MRAFRSGFRPVSPVVPASRPCRAARSVAAVLLAALLGAAAVPFAAAPARAASAVTEARLLKQLYLVGLARIARGDPAGAAKAFEVVSEVAPELPQPHYSLAMAMMLADFGRRERAVAIVDRALAADPSHPLYNIVRVLADPAFSVLREDGALYLSAAAAGRLRAAASRLASAPEGYNSRYLAPVLNGIEATDDAAFPFRLAKFDGMIGPGGKVTLAHLGESFAFGRLFALSVPDAKFDTHAGPAVAALPGGIESLADAKRPGAARSSMEILIDRPSAPRG